MSNGSMLKDIKDLIESGESFTTKQYQVLSLSGMVELGDEIKDVRAELKNVNTAAQTRVCPEVAQAQKDIEDLEKKSNRMDTLVGAGTILGTIAGLIFGNK